MLQALGEKVACRYWVGGRVAGRVAVDSVWHLLGLRPKWRPVVCDHCCGVITAVVKCDHCCGAVVQCDRLRLLLLLLCCCCLLCDHTV